MPEEGQQVIIGEEEPEGLAPGRVLAREYVHGPGDAHAGVDETLAIFDAASSELAREKPWWVLQDASGDVVALCETPRNQPACVARQFVYDAYGSVVVAETLRSSPNQTLGHKGLFIDRLDVGVADPASWAAGITTDTPRLVPHAHAVYHVRNRVYQPTLGRWMQRDPNATAMTLIESVAHSGRAMSALAGLLDVDAMYGDGMNVYEYLGGNPLTRRDPLGLSYDPFDMVDEYLAESAAETAAFLNALGEGLKAAAIVSAKIATYLPFPGASVAGELALVALGEQTGQDVIIGVAMGFGAGKVVAMASRLVGKIGSKVWDLTKKYVGTYGSRFIEGATSIAKRALSWIRGCGCFEAGTLVWTMRGPIPIEEVQDDDSVLAIDTETGEWSIRSVTARLVRSGAPIVVVTLMAISDSGAQHYETLNTTEEHPFLVERWVPHTKEVGEQGTGSLEWLRADQLQPGMLVRQLSGQAAEVQAIQFTGRLSTVYNFEVEGLHNYAVGHQGFVVHNGPPYCAPDLGRKLEYLFGNATGSKQNSDRSIALARQLNRIGIQGDANGRAIVTEHLTLALNNPMNIVSQQGVRTVRESLLAGPGGFLKIESIWDGNKLITVKLLGG